MGQQRFPLVEPGTEDQAAVIIEDMQQRRLPILTRQPPVRRSVILPELAYFLGLPAPDRLAFGFGFFSGQGVSQSETAHGGPSRFESKAAQQFRSDGTVRAAMMEQVTRGGFDFPGPGLTTIAAGKAGIPEVSFALGHGFEIRMIELVEAARAQVQFVRPFRCFDVASAKTREDVTNEWSAEAL